jgi:NADH-quinone oxidoreductase subunit G
MANVKLTIDGKELEVPAGTLVVEAAKQVGIDIPTFCYYRGLALQAACRMCLVEVEKAPKLLTACTLPAAEGMVVRTDTPAVVKARKDMLEFLLTNHPLDCPVCDKGGECELQDTVLRYGLGESRFTEIKQHVDEKQWSPVVYYDAPRCILCFRCVRICSEGMNVGALGIVNRGVASEIAPNRGDFLACDECGMCIDICPVGALTSGMYRYKTRPWEMNHVGTICTHCSDGCKTTLGVRNNQVIRANNRDRSGINEEFLCIKGRYGSDFVNREERLESPLMRVDGSLQPVSWAKALKAVAEKFAEVKARNGKFGVIGSNHTTNEENFYLQKFAREGLGTESIDHHRTGDVGALTGALNGNRAALAKTADLYNAKAVLIVASDMAQQHPFLEFQVRANWRHHQSHIYTVTAGPVREDNFATRSVRVKPGGELDGVRSLGDALKAEPELVLVFGDAIQGAQVKQLVEFGGSLGIPVKYVCLVDYSNSRGAADFGLLPGDGGLTLPEMLAAEVLDVLWVVGANPLKSWKLAAKNAFVVVQELFLTETAQAADVVFPAASEYEKSGTVTNVCGEVQQLTSALKIMGTKPDLEIFRLLAKDMGLDPDSYNIPLPAELPNGTRFRSTGGIIESARDTLFTSGTLGRYSKSLNSVAEAPGDLYRG